MNFIINTIFNLTVNIHIATQAFKILFTSYCIGDYFFINFHNSVSYFKYLARNAAQILMTAYHFSS